MKAINPEARKKGIGGSDAPVVCGLSPWKTPFQLYLEKRGEVEQQEPINSEATHFGKVLEEIVAQEYMRRTGRKVRKVNDTLVHKKYPFIFGHIDRRVVGERRLLECKTTSSFMRDEWGEPGSDEIPACYIVQVQHYLAVTGFEIADVAVLLGGSDFRIYTVRRDDDLINQLIELEYEFWQRVNKGDPPKPQTLDDVKIRFPRDKGGVIQADATVLGLIDNLTKLKASISELQNLHDNLQQKIMSYMGDNAILEYSGAKLATWKLQSAQRFDTKAFAADYPELYAKYKKTIESRVFRFSKIKGGKE